MPLRSIQKQMASRCLALFPSPPLKFYAKAKAKAKAKKKSDRKINKSKRPRPVTKTRAAFLTASTTRRMGVATAFEYNKQRGSKASSE